jgi:hypothetical protein
MLLISTFNKYNIENFYLFFYVDIYNVMFLFYSFYFGYSDILLYQIKKGIFMDYKIYYN